MVDSHRAFEVTAPASRAIPEGIGHLLELFICQSGIAEDPSPQNPGNRKMTPIDRQQEFGPEAGDVPIIPGCLVDLAVGAAPGALGAHPDVLIQGNPVIGVFQDGGKGFQEAAGPVLDIKILDVISNGKTLPLDYFGFSGIGKSLLSFFLSKRSHGSPTFSFYD
jgi:hypothetical protein